jgi:hypothetical protein
MSSIITQISTTDSSTIDSFHYDNKNQLLLVTFKHGKSYSYFNVDKSTYIAFMNDAFDSPGKALNTHIKSKFDFTLLDETILK